MILRREGQARRS